jgi:hypothetical protein
LVYFRRTEGTKEEGTEQSWNEAGKGKGKEELIRRTLRDEVAKKPRQSEKGKP